MIQVASGLEVRSPGIIPHIVTAYSVDGLDDLVVTVVSDDSILARDTTIIPFDLFHLTASLAWQVPAGIPTGTRILLVARVRDLIGFAASDSAVFFITP